MVYGGWGGRDEAGNLERCGLKNTFYGSPAHIFVNMVLFAGFH